MRMAIQAVDGDDTVREDTFSLSSAHRHRGLLEVYPDRLIRFANKMQALRAGLIHLKRNFGSTAGEEPCLSRAKVCFSKCKRLPQAARRVILGANMTRVGLEQEVEQTDGSHTLLLHDNICEQQKGRRWVG